MSIKDTFIRVKEQLRALIDGRTNSPQNTEIPKRQIAQPQRPWYWFFRSSWGTVWMQYNGKEYIDDTFPWKLHVFASSIEDYEQIAQPIAEALHRLDITFKTIDFKYDDSNLHAILDAYDANGNPNSQYGKAFTIYFNDAESMYRIAKYIDTLCTSYYHIGRTDNCEMLEFDKHNLGTEKQYGKSGRVFYRAERDVNGEYIYADDARKINPKQPHNPYNLPDPIQQGIEQDQKDFAFIVAHMSVLNLDEGKFAIEPGYEDEMIAILERHMPQLWQEKTPDGCIEFQSGLSGIYTVAFFDGLKDYVKYINLLNKVKSKKQSQKS